MRRLSSVDLARVAAFAALIAALGLLPPISAFGLAVPITAQTLGVMLAGSVLGAKRGALSVTVFLTLVALGLPLLSGGRGGLGVFAGPSAGFLIGWVFGAYVIGWLIERKLRRGAAYTVPYGFMANVVGGIGVIYAFGIPVLSWRADMSLGAAATASLAFIPGDLIKAGIAAVVAKGTHEAVPGLVPVRELAVPADTAA